MGYTVQKSNPSGRWDFPHPSRLAPGLTQPSLQWVWDFFTRGKAAMLCSWPPTSSSTKVKGRVELYLYTSGPSWLVKGWTFLYLSFRCDILWFCRYIPMFHWNMVSIGRRVYSLRSQKMGICFHCYKNLCYFLWLVAGCWIGFLMKIRHLVCKFVLIAYWHMFWIVAIFWLCVVLFH